MPGNREDFLQLWQGKGWLTREATMKPFARLVLSYLRDVLRFGNRIPGSRAAARELGRDHAQVSRAYTELTGQGFIVRHQQSGCLMLDPTYCWKGTRPAYEAALGGLYTYRLRKTRKVIPPGKRAVKAAQQHIKESYIDKGGANGATGLP